MTKKYFNKEYAEYWQKRVVISLDGSRVPDEKVESFFIEKLGIESNDIVLDLGCGHGRLFPILGSLSKNVFGIDVNEEAIKLASSNCYKSLTCASAENTKLTNDYFDKIVAWATYDVVEQKEALIEENRILKNNGLLLITGKNKDYRDDDYNAFVAERNAKLKDFPNHFTDVYGLIDNARVFGLKVREAWGFTNRGSFGELDCFDILTETKRPFYEFLIIFEKVGDYTREQDFAVCDEYSDRAIEMSKSAGFDNVLDFFKYHKEQFND